MKTLKLNLLDKKLNIGYCKKINVHKVGDVLAVKNVLRAPFFLNFRNFGTKPDTTKKLESNS